VAGLPGRWTGPGRCVIAVQVGLIRGWRTERDRGSSPHSSVTSAW
jgi:hypothetical protein